MILPIRSPRTSETMVIEVRIVATFVGKSTDDWEGAQGSLLGGRNKIFLGLGGGYTGVSIQTFIKLYIRNLLHLNKKVNKMKNIVPIKQNYCKD